MRLGIRSVVSFYCRSCTFLAEHKMIDVPKKGTKFVLARHFDGLPKLDNFKLIEVDIPELQTGGIFYCAYQSIL